MSSENSPARRHATRPLRSQLTAIVSPRRPTVYPRDQGPTIDTRPARNRACVRSAAVTFYDTLERSTSLWAAASALLRAWQSAIPERIAYDSDDESYDRWSRLEDEAFLHFVGRRASDDFGDADRRFLLKATEGGADADAIHAAAWGMTFAVRHALVQGWRDEVALKDGRLQLKDGDLYPVAESPWKWPGIQSSSRPAALSAPERDELPYIRMHRGEWDVCIDFSFEESLEAIASGLACVAALHPNERWDEIRFTPGDSVPTPEGELPHQFFPIEPADPAAQGRVVQDLARTALGSKAAVSVLPELALRAEHVDQLADIVREHPSPHLLIAGSHHVVERGRRENVAVGLLAGRSDRLTHKKTTPATFDFGGSHPMKEGIARRERLELTVYQADRYRLAMPICKELLDVRMTEALDRLGVNLLLVPSLSPKSAPYGVAVGMRVARAQALSFVVNGPLRGPDEQPILPPVLIGQPVSGREQVALPADGPAACVTVVSLPVLDNL